MIAYNLKLSKDELMKLNIIIDEDSQVADGVEIEPNVCIKQSVINKGCKIRANSVLENCVVGDDVDITASFVKDSTIGKNSTVGPFAHVRNNSHIGSFCRIGNFVEIKNSTLGDFCKVAHLSYVGDAEIGVNCNVGCGVVFCNYNGRVKQKTVVGNNAFIGSNVNLIAPVVIGDFVYIAAGSTINKNIEKDSFAIARARQENKKGFNNPYKKY